MTGHHKRKKRLSLTGGIKIINYEQGGSHLSEFNRMGEVHKKVTKAEKKKQVWFPKRESKKNIKTEKKKGKIRIQEQDESKDY